MASDIYTQVKAAVNLYFSTIFIPTGIALNFISAIVFFRRRLNNKTTLGYLHAFLCIFNIFSLTNSILFVQLFPLLNIDLQDVNLFTCTFLNVWEKVALQIPSMQQLLVTFKIYVDVCHPKRFVFMRDCRKLGLIMVAFAVILFAADSIYFSFYMGYRTTSSSSSSSSTSTKSNSSNSSSSSSSSSAKIECVNTSLVSFGADLINMLMRDFVPFLLMTALNTQVCYTLIKSKRKLALTANNEQFRRTLSFTVSVVIMNVIFFLLFLPWSVSFIIGYVYKFTSVTSTDIFNMFKTFATTVAFLNNFTVFIASFITNRLFRQELFYVVQHSLAFVCLGVVKSEPRRPSESSRRSVSLRQTSITKITPATTH